MVNEKTITVTSFTRHTVLQWALGNKCQSKGERWHHSYA